MTEETKKLLESLMARWHAYAGPKPQRIIGLWKSERMALVVLFGQEVGFHIVFFDLRDPSQFIVTDGILSVTSYKAGSVKSSRVILEADFLSNAGMYRVDIEETPDEGGK